MRYFSTKPTSVSDWLRQATERLNNGGNKSARLDAELILASVLGHDRTWLHAHPEQTLTSSQRRAANRLIVKRLDHTPIAYLTGHKDFYGRSFFVNRHTLVPRPESEDMIDLLKKHLHASHTRLVDVGAGSGCLGITAKLEFPRLDISLIDISRPALKVARRNAERLDATIQTLRSNLLANYQNKVDVILANLPYVNPEWEPSLSTKHEPTTALYADQGGLALIFKLIDQSRDKLTAKGLMILEADPEQHAAIVEHAKKTGLKKIAALGYQIAFTKL